MITVTLVTVTPNTMVQACTVRMVSHCWAVKSRSMQVRKPVIAKAKDIGGTRKQFPARRLSAASRRLPPMVIREKPLRPRQTRPAGRSLNHIEANMRAEFQGPFRRPSAAARFAPLTWLNGNVGGRFRRRSGAIFAGRGCVWITSWESE